MIMIMRLNVEIELVTAVCGEVPNRGHSHHLLHLLLTVGQVGQETALRLLPWRAVGHAQPLPLLAEGVGQVNMSSSPTGCCAVQWAMWKGGGLTSRDRLNSSENYLLLGFLLAMSSQTVLLLFRQSLT